MYLPTYFKIKMFYLVTTTYYIPRTIKKYINIPWWVMFKYLHVLVENILCNILFTSIKCILYLLGKVNIHISLIWKRPSIVTGFINKIDTGLLVNATSLAGFRYILPNIPTPVLLLSSDTLTIILFREVFVFCKQ